MKEHVELLADPPQEEPDDPPEVQIASVLLLDAMGTPFPQFSLRREGVDLPMELPDGGCCHLAQVLLTCLGGERFADWDLPLLTAKIWERFLKMAGLTDPAATAGTSQVSCRTHFPHTDWTITVTRDGPDKLDFSLSLDRVDTTMPTSP